MKGKLRNSGWTFYGHLEKQARPAGLEPATDGVEVRYSIQLSYGRIISPILPQYTKKPRHRPPCQSESVFKYHLSDFVRNIVPQLLINQVT